jgi:hypothetical protein
MIAHWEQIEHAWSEAVCDSLSAIANAHPKERFYAGAFWLLYGDYTSLQCPVFGLNSEQTDPDIRWHPPDWRWSIVDQAHERVRPLYEGLLSLGGDERSFEILWEEHIDMLARVSRRVTELARSRKIPGLTSELSEGFFVGIIDFSQGEAAFDYLKRSVDEITLRETGLLDEAM